MKRALGALVVGAVLVEGLVACGSADPGAEQAVVVQTPDTVKNANVQIGLLDSSGIRRGNCSGVLIGPRMVLTAGHCISGKAKWSVLSAAGSRANGVRAFTPDWLDFETGDAHPARHDIGVIMLDQDITLPVYPKLASSEAAADASLVRIRNVGGEMFEARAATATHVDAMPHTYMTGMASDEALDTGGAVLNDKGAIVGVISGRGTTTGNLYVARVDAHFVWVGAKNSCSSGGTTADSTDGQIGVACHPTGGGGGGSSNGGSCTKDAGSGSCGGSGSDAGSGGDSGGSSGSSGGGSGSSGGDSGGSCQDSGGGGNCSGDCPGGSGGSVSGSDSGGDSSGGSNSGSSTGSNGSTGSSGSSGGDNSGGASGSNGSNSGSNTGSNGSSGSGSSGGDNSGGGGAGGAASGSNGSSAGSNTGSSNGSNSGSSSGSNTGSNSGSNTGSNSGSNTGSNSGGSSGSTGSNSGSNSGSSTGNTGSNGSTTAGSTGTFPGSGTVLKDSCYLGCPDETIDYGDCGCVNPGSGVNVIK